jgi:hypothetical protein
MIIERISILTGKVNTMDLPVTMEQLNLWLYDRKLIQNVMPNLTPTQREFLISGMSEEEQLKFFGE